jgi:hypothetical protein
VDGRTEAEQFEKDRHILLDEMLPKVVGEGAVEGVDHFFFQEIISGHRAHENGKILAKTYNLLRAGRANAIMVTDVTRITRDAEVAVALLKLGNEMKISVITRDRLTHPFRLWNHASRKEFVMHMSYALMEGETSQERYDRSFDSAYPMSDESDEEGRKLANEERTNRFQGLGRHVTTVCGLGYKPHPETGNPEPFTTEWRRKNGKVVPAIPCPDYIPPGAKRAPAYNWYEILGMALQYGKRLGRDEISRLLKRETGVSLSADVINYTLRNPFNAGRPTSRIEMINHKERKREQPVFTIGSYPTHITYEEFQDLQAALDARMNSREKTGSVCWASGLAYCACGEPFVGLNAHYYCCRGKASYHNRNKSDINASLLKTWQSTPTCGNLHKVKLHTALEGHLRAAFSAPDLLERVERYETAQLESSSTREMQRLEEARLEMQLTEIEGRRERELNLYSTGFITFEELGKRLKGVDRHRDGLCARLSSLRESLDIPVLTPDTVTLIRKLVSTDALRQFDHFWQVCTPEDKRCIVRAIVDRIEVGGTGKRRVVGLPVYTALVGPDTPCGPEYSSLHLPGYERKPYGKPGKCKNGARDVRGI